MNQESLYQRLGGYDGITAFSDNLLPRLQGDSQLGRFWQNRGDDGIAREKQLLIDYLCSNAGGPMYYTGRDMNQETILRACAKWSMSAVGVSGEFVRNVFWWVVMVCVFG